MSSPALQVAPTILQALLARDLSFADAEVRRLAATEGLGGAYRVLREVLYEIGTLWEAGGATVAQEHYCTAAVQRIMARLQGDALARPRLGRTVLAASVGGNHHAIGIRMVADLFESRGWATTCLGADSPSDTIVATLAGPERFDILALSATLEAHLPEVAHVIRCARAVAPSLKILVGGLVFGSAPELWRRVGADGHAHDPEEAVALAERLLVEPAGTRRRLTLVPPTPEASSELHETARALASRNAELARANAQLNRVMGVMAHDLRNPLTVIGHFVEFLRMDLAAALGPEQREMLDAIEQSAGYMKELVDDALDTSLIGAGKLVLELESVEILGYLRSAIARNAPIASRKQIALVLASDLAACEVRLDRQRMQQVINNLTSNAIQYSHPGSTVELAVAVAGPELEIAVRDHGQGIDPAELPRVFGAFETTRTRGTQGEKSTGLGLAIVKSVIEAHRGRVAVDSVLGEGTTFRVYLPLG